VKLRNEEIIYKYEPVKLMILGFIRFYSENSKILKILIQTRNSENPENPENPVKRSKRS